ncbi:MAG: Lrp/AsnC family transcriptional regulator, partial [archaeon]
DLSKRHRLSRDAIKKRIDKLKREEVIVGAIPIINMPIFGYGSHKVFIDLLNCPEDIENQIFDDLTKHQSIFWILKTSGNYDIMIAIAARNNLEIDKILWEIRNKYNVYIKEIIVLSALEDLNYSHLPKAFIKGIKTSPISYRKDDSSFGKLLSKHVKELYHDKLQKIDFYDLKILEILSQDTRIEIKELSKNLKLSPETVKNRIKKMIENGILQGFSALISLSKIGYSWNILFIKLKIKNPEIIKKWKLFVKEGLYFPWVQLITGKWDLYLHIYCSGIVQLHEIIEDIKNRLGDTIQDYETLLIFKEIKVTHFCKSYYDCLEEK